MNTAPIPSWEDPTWPAQAGIISFDQSVVLLYPERYSSIIIFKARISVLAAEKPQAIVTGKFFL